MNYTVSDFYKTFENGLKLIAGAGGMSRTVTSAGILDYEMESGFSLCNDPIIHRLWIKPTQNGLQNVLIIVPGIVTGPNHTLVFLIEAFQLVGIVDNHGFFSGVQVDQDNQPVIPENLKIIEDHQLTSFQLL